MVSYLLATLVIAGIYAILALGLNVIWGLGGMVNLGLAGFFAVGAYTSALSSIGGLPIWLACILAMVIAGSIGALLARLTLNLRGDYLAIVTLGFGELVRLIAANELWLTNGSDGISGIPGPWRGDLTPLQFNMLFAVLIVVLVVTIWWLTTNLRKSPMGRALRALADDETAAAVAGKPVRKMKVQAFALGSAVIGFGGALYGHYFSYIAPDLFRPLIAIYIFLAVTAGGTGRPSGAVLGAIVVIAVLEGTRYFGDVIPYLSGVKVAALREILVGSLLVVIMRLRPEGLIPARPTTRANI
ncbi:branched-chain amino acid ABC transporter permease [Rhodobacteraceae bacterium D3-12]|nr:branched-chain amino acid ABC transporter permease [Rhodobacteraceae bacterium D3-12]